MAFFRSLLKTLISQSSKSKSKCPLQNPNSPSSSSSSSRTFFSLCSTSQPYNICHNPSNVIIRNPFLLRRHFLSPLSSAFGPLFLSSPPWQLSQSATPLHLQCDVVLLKLPKVPNALNTIIPYRLGFQDINSKKNNINSEEFSGSKLADNADSDSLVKVTDNYLNLPNFISFGRLLSGPLLGWMITNDMYLSSFVGLGISGATDWLDGYLARKMGINSVVGSYLDPLADKILIGSVALGMVYKGLLHPGLVALVVLRDVALVGGAVYKRASSLEWQWKSWFDFFNLDGTHPEKVEPLLISKVNTVLQLVLVAAALLQPEFGNDETRLYITYLSWLVVLTTLGSTAAYGAQHLRIGSKSIGSRL